MVAEHAAGATYLRGKKSAHAPKPVVLLKK
jgi:hypothetical protein